MNATGFVYVIGEQGESEGLVKVGWSRDVERRLLALQTGNPRRLEVLVAIESTRTQETSVHAWLGKAERGEWFARSPKIEQLLTGTIPDSLPPAAGTIVKCALCLGAGRVNDRVAFERLAKLGLDLEDMARRAVEETIEGIERERQQAAA